MNCDIFGGLILCIDIGKLMNQYAARNFAKPKPRGWGWIDLLVDPWTYRFNVAVFSANGQVPVHYPELYAPDVLNVKTLDRLDGLVKQDKPFLLFVAPISPHGEFSYSKDHGLVVVPPVPATRHQGLFRDKKAPRTPNFNPADGVHRKPSWLKNLPRLSPEEEAEIDEAYRQRLRSLAAVDELVGDIYSKLADVNKLESTYIMYSTDNGFKLGQHRVQGGKTLPYTEDTKGKSIASFTKLNVIVPMIVRGPGITAGSVVDSPSSHVDIAPTFLKMAKVKDMPVIFDGQPMKLWSEPDDGTETVNIEYWVFACLNIYMF